MADRGRLLAFQQRREKVMTSKTTYSWRTSCSELVDNFQNGKRTKVFYSQLRVLTKKYGTVKKEKYNFVRNLKTA